MYHDRSIPPIKGIQLYLFSILAIRTITCNYTKVVDNYGKKVVDKGKYEILYTHF